MRWIEDILIKIQGSISISEDDKFQLAQTVFFIGYKELVRQVSVYCAERGVVVWKLWRGYLNLIENLSNNYKQKIRKHNAKNESKILNLHNLYDKEMNEIKNSRDALQNQNQILAQENSEIQKKMTKFRTQLENNVKEHNSEVEKLKNDLKEMTLYRAKYRDAKEVIKRQALELSKDNAHYIETLSQLKANRVKESEIKLKVRKQKSLKLSEKEVQAVPELTEDESNTEIQNFIQSESQTVSDTLMISNTIYLNHFSRPFRPGISSKHQSPQDDNEIYSEFSNEAPPIDLKILPSNSPSPSEVFNSPESVLSDKFFKHSSDGSRTRTKHISRGGSIESSTSIKPSPQSIKKKVIVEKIQEENSEFQNTVPKTTILQDDNGKTASKKDGLIGSSTSVQYQ